LTATTRDRSYGSSVILPLLPPGYIPRVMNFGGGNPATSSTEIIDLSAATRGGPGPSMSSGRIQMNAVILRTAMFSPKAGRSTTGTEYRWQTADLYDPATNSMRSAGAAAYSRLYPPLHCYFLMRL
jgi:hypothetical protein